LDLVSDIHLLALCVVDLVAHVLVRGLVEVQNGQNLTVVGHEGLTNGVRALHKRLEHLESDVDDFSVAGVQCSFDRNDQLWDNWEDLGSALLEHVEGALDGEETVRVRLLAEALEENGQVVVIVKLGYLNFPSNPVLRSMLDRNRQVTSIVKIAELTGSDHTRLHSTGHWLVGHETQFCLHGRVGFATDAISFLQHHCFHGSLYLVVCSYSWRSDWRPLQTHSILLGRLFHGRKRCH